MVEEGERITLAASFCHRRQRYGPTARDASVRLVRMAPYERLKAWQECHRLVLETYHATKSFPREELYGLTSQARRAAFSAAVNIVEGSAKRGAREFRRFLDISIGSLAELAYTLQVARDLGLLDSDRWAELERIRRQAG